MASQDRHQRSRSVGQTTDTCEVAALAYRRLGWSVIPLRPKEKVPKIPWQEFQDRQADEDEIRAWFKRWPKANLGIVTGPVSGLVVLDVDPRHGGGKSLTNWIEQHGPLPTTPEAETGGGVYYYGPYFPSPTTFQFSFASSELANFFAALAEFFRGFFLTISISY